MGVHKIGAAMALAAALLFAPVEHAMSQTTPAIPHIQQVDLNVDSSLRALKAWESLKKLSDSVQGKDLNQLQALSAHQRSVSAVQSHGFDDFETWYRTLFTFVLSANAIGKEDQFANIPEGLRKTMAQFLPKPTNVAAAKEALQDPEVARIYQELK